ncbi:MAG: glycine dehydrogenase (aminomethyl-transferring), partial [Nodosilinea sp.]
MAMTPPFSEPTAVAPASLADLVPPSLSSPNPLQQVTEPGSSFVVRHLGPTGAQIDTMLEVLGYSSLEALVAATVPGSIRLQQDLQLPQGLDEAAALARLRQIADRNQVWRSFIGLGYANTLTPLVIQRNILENPGWYTQYTPYQPEIAQGRLEALLNFQTLITDLTGMEIANASLLDEGTAAAEAMALAFNARQQKSCKTFWVAADCHPQTLEVVQTRAQPLGIEVVVGDHRDLSLTAPVFGLLLQYPATDGALYDYDALVN